MTYPARADPHRLEGHYVFSRAGSRVGGVGVTADGQGVLSGLTKGYKMRLWRWLRNPVNMHKNTGLYAH